VILMQLQRRLNHSLRRTNSAPARSGTAIAPQTDDANFAPPVIWPAQGASRTRRHGAFWSDDAPRVSALRQARRLLNHHLGAICIT
jgi:hypothetical protein